MEVQVKRPSELSEAEIASWNALRDSNPALSSPCYSVLYARAAEDAGLPARIAVVHEDGAIVAFLGYQIATAGLARPIGGVMSDAHGLVTSPGAPLDVREILRRSGRLLFSYENAPVGQVAAFSGFRVAGGYCVMDLSEGFDVWLEMRRQLKAKAFRNLRSRTNRLKRDGREVTYVWDDRRDVAFDTLLEWKSAQYVRTGKIDLLSFPWSVRFLQTLRKQGNADLSGLVSTMSIDGAIAAVHFGLVSGGVLHHWFPAYDPAHSTSSPGNMLLMHMAEAGAAEGIREIHLGRGETGYKIEFASFQMPVAEGVSVASPVIGFARGVVDAANTAFSWKRLGPARHLPKRVVRRVDRMLSMRGA